MKLQSWSVLLFKVEFQRIRQYITDSRHYFPTSYSYSSSDLLLSSTKEFWSYLNKSSDSLKLPEVGGAQNRARPPSALFVTRALFAASLPAMKTGLQSSLEWISHSPLLCRSKGISYRPVPPCARFLYRSWGFEPEFLMLAWHTG